MTATGTEAPVHPAAIEHPAQWPVYSQQAVARAAALISAGRTFDYGYGPELEQFEQAYADRHGRTHALALASGTVGLLAAFFALGIRPGDEVIVPDYTFFSTATPLLLLGAVPVLADADPVNGCIDPGEVSALAGPRTVAVVMTHLWGHPCAINEVEAVARRHGLALVEDCSHAHGSTYHGRPVGSTCDVAVFSTGGHKAVSGGLGGVLLTDDQDIYARACLLTNFRHRTDLTIIGAAYRPFLDTGLGSNCRMSPMAALLAASHLDDLDQRVDARQRNMTRLLDGLTGLPGLAVVPVAPGCTTGAWYDGVVAWEPGAPLNRDETVRVLVAAGLRVRAPSTRPLHCYPLFHGSVPDWSPLLRSAARAAAVANDRRFPHAERLNERWIRLPVNFLWDDEGRIVDPYVERAQRVWDAAGAV